LLESRDKPNPTTESESPALSCPDYVIALMAQVGRETTAMATPEPMAVDACGLGVSRHASSQNNEPAGPKQQPARDREANSDWARVLKSWKYKIAGLVTSGELDKLDHHWDAMLQEAADALRGSDASNTTLTIEQQLRELATKINNIDTRLKTTTNPLTNGTTYAKVAASGATNSSGESAVWATQKVIPARHTREVIIKASENQSAELASRKAPEIIQSVNTALGTNSAVAARRLRSGDTVVTFRWNASQYTSNAGWVEKAFGTGAALSQRAVTVLAKRIPAEKMKGLSWEAITEALQKDNEGAGILKAKGRTPKAERTCVIKIQVGTWMEAQALCDRGLIWEAQIFDCEPYSPELELRQCFACHGFGHHAKYCNRPARCGHCGGAAHKDENACPEYGDNGHKKCVNCSGGHVPWSRNCPVLREQLSQRREAYAHRPLGFRGTGAESSLGTGPSTSLPTSSSSDDFMEVRPRKRRLTTAPTATATVTPPAPRGRPRELSRPEAGNQRIDEVLVSSQRSSAPDVQQEVIVIPMES
jgi:hypothetical protein